MINKYLFAIFLVVLISPIHAQKKYQIGTGVSFGYYKQYINLILNSYHLFGSENNIDDKALLTIGMGFNKNLYTEAQDLEGSFGMGIGFISMIPLYKPPLKQFGTGFSIDYRMFNISTHGLGGTIYFLLDSYLLGIGGGIGIDTKLNVLPYMNFSLALVF